MSLEPWQLDHIAQQGWYSVGVNRIYRIYEQTSWQPDIVFMADYMRGRPEEINNDISQHLRYGYPLRVRGDLGKFIRHDLAEGCTAFFDCSHSIAAEPDDMWHPKQHLHPEYATNEWHLPSYCKAGGTLFIAMQHVVMEGFGRIILIGCDGKYTRDEKTNHFIPDYLPPDVQRTPEQANMDNHNIRHAHKVAARECKVRDVEVLNCSVFSDIPQYQKVNLYDVPILT